MEEEKLVELAKLALRDELFAVKIYSMAAGLSKTGSTRDRLLKISRMEEEHADFWRKLLRRRGIDPSEVSVGFLKTSLYAVFLRLFGLALTFRLMESGERDAVELYSRMLGSPELKEDEKNALKKILEDELVHEQELAEEESRFMKMLDHIRDAVLGMNDGLVEILSVTMGLVGAYGSAFHVALSGLATIPLILHESSYPILEYVGGVSRREQDPR
ncbi:MAG TPA: hypothetical protein ENF79_02260 [Nitrososphaeria archaeon]|nr:hypothetical protein [Nitrososphaeria archaeon]